MDIKAHQGKASSLTLGTVSRKHRLKSHLLLQPLCRGKRNSRAPPANQRDSCTRPLASMVKLFPCGYLTNSHPSVPYSPVKPQPCTVKAKLIILALAADPYLEVAPCDGAVIADPDLGLPKALVLFERGVVQVLCELISLLFLCRVLHLRVGHGEEALTEVVHDEIRVLVPVSLNILLESVDYLFSQ